MSENINVILVSFYTFSAPPIFIETDSQSGTSSSFSKSWRQAFTSFAASHAELRRLNLSFLIYLKNMGKFIIYRVAQKSLDPRHLTTVSSVRLLLPLSVDIYIYIYIYIYIHTFECVQVAYNYTNIK